MYKRFPEAIATVPFLSFGIIFGYLLYLQETNFEEIFSVWPFFALVAAILVTSAILVIPKNLHGKYIFEHFVYLYFANVLFLVSGLLFMLSDETAIALYVGTVSGGIVYITTLSYVTIRSEKKSRSFNIALCHVWKLCGIALLRSLESLSAPYQFEFKFYMGVVLIISACISILLQLLNEYRQRKGIVYNYKDALEHDVSIANNYCKLFSKNEVIIERNNTVTSTSLWKSTEQLLPRNRKNYSITWIFYIVFLKLHGSVLFFYPLLVFTVIETGRFFSEQTPALPFWFVAAGGVIGCLLTPFFRIHYIYTIGGLAAIIAIASSHIVLYNNDILIFILWVYFFLMSVLVGVPDIAIMEVSKIKYNEPWLAAGCVLEFLPFGILKFLYIQELVEYDFDTEGHLLNILVVTVVLVVTALFLVLHMPNTFNKSLLQIQNEMLKHKKYFAFLGKEKEQSSTVASRDRTFENIYAVNNNSSTNIFESHENALNTSKSSPPNNFDYDKEIKVIPNLIPRFNVGKKKQQFSPVPNRKRGQENLPESHPASRDTPGVSNFNYESEITVIPNLIPRVRLNSASADNPQFRLKTVD